MTETRHTPGPWGLTREGFGFSVRSSGHAGNGYSSEHICSMDHYRDDRVDEQRGNANLIAAAPDMLAALQGIVDCVARTETMGEICQCDDFSAARAAIAKAKGGAA